jgi:hypothetical protein
MLWQPRPNLMRKVEALTREQRQRYYDRQVRLGMTFAILWASGGFLIFHFNPIISDVISNEPNQEW